MTRETIIPEAFGATSQSKAYRFSIRILARTGLAECLLSKGFAGGGPLAEFSVFGDRRGDDFCLRRPLNRRAIERCQYHAPTPQWSAE